MFSVAQLMHVFFFKDDDYLQFDFFHDNFMLILDVNLSCLSLYHLVLLIIIISSNKLLFLLLFFLLSLLYYY